MISTDLGVIEWPVVIHDRAGGAVCKDVPPYCIQCEALVQHDPVAGGVVRHHSVPTACVRKPCTQQWVNGIRQKPFQLWS
jgi:hypothetical protein